MIYLNLVYKIGGGEKPNCKILHRTSNVFQGKTAKHPDLEEEVLNYILGKQEFGYTMSPEMTVDGNRNHKRIGN